MLSGTVPALYFRPIPTWRRQTDSKIINIHNFIYYEKYGDVIKRIGGEICQKGASQTEPLTNDYRKSSIDLQSASVFKYYVNTYK